MTYREAVKSSFGIGLVLVILGMVTTAIQGLAYTAESAVWPIAGMVLAGVGLFLMLTTRDG